MFYIYTFQLLCFLYTNKVSTGDPYYRHSYDNHRQLRTIQYYSEESGDSSSNYEPELAAQSRKRCGKKYKKRDKCKCVTCCFKCPPKVEQCCEEKCNDNCQEGQDEEQANPTEETQPKVILQPYPAPVMVPFPVMAPFPFGPYGPGVFGPFKKNEKGDDDKDKGDKDKDKDNKDKDKKSEEIDSTTRKELPTIIPRECPGLAKCYSVNVDDFRRYITDKIELITELPKYGLIKLPSDLDISRMNSLNNNLKGLKLRRTLML